jgi:hypothetical protein
MLREEIKRLAKSIADELWEDALAGKLPKIGIDEVRVFIVRIVPKKLNHEAAELLEEQTLHYLIEKVG